MHKIRITCCVTGFKPLFPILHNNVLKIVTRFILLMVQISWIWCTLNWRPLSRNSKRLITKKLSTSNVLNSYRYLYAFTFTKLIPFIMFNENLKDIIDLKNLTCPRANKWLLILVSCSCIRSFIYFLFSTTWLKWFRYFKNKLSFCTFITF